MVVMGLVLGCATGRADPPYAATEEPPPRGAPQPRLGHIPPPPPNPGADSDEGGLEDQRTLALQGQQRQERAQRQGSPESRVEVVNPPPAPSACDNLTAEERLECPLDDPREVESIVDTPDGVRVSLRPGGASAARLRQRFDCLRSLSATRPGLVSACSFLDTRTAQEITATGNRVTVELRRPPPVDALRREVRTALQR